MSARLRVKVIEEYDLPRAQRDVLVGLVKYAQTEDEVVWRSLDEVAWEMGVARKTAWDAQRDLIRLGWLVVVEKAAQHRPYRFRVNWHALPPKQPYARVDRKRKEQDGTASSGVPATPLRGGASGVAAPPETDDTESETDCQEKDRKNEGADDAPRDTTPEAITTTGADDAVISEAMVAVESVSPPGTDLERIRRRLSRYRAEHPKVDLAEQVRKWTARAREDAPTSSRPSLSR